MFTSLYVFIYSVFCHGKYKCCIWNDHIYFNAYLVYKQKCIWELFKVNPNQIPNTGLSNEMNKRAVFRSIYFLNYI